MFKNPFSFKGRIRRTEYGLSYLIYLGLLFIFSLAIEGTGAFGQIIYLLIYVPLGWFMLAQGAKRCHDLNNSGWYLFIPFYALWLFFEAGKNGTNRYGLNPKSLVDTSEIDEIGKPMNDI